MGTSAVPSSQKHQVGTRKHRKLRYSIALCDSEGAGARTLDLRIKSPQDMSRRCPVRVLRVSVSLIRAAENATSANRWVFGGKDPKRQGLQPLRRSDVADHLPGVQVHRL